MHSPQQNCYSKMQQPLPIFFFFATVACNSFVCVKSFARLTRVVSKSLTLFSICFDLLICSIVSKPVKTPSLDGLLTKNHIKRTNNLIYLSNYFFGRRRCCRRRLGSLCSLHVWKDILIIK